MKRTLLIALLGLGLAGLVALALVQRPAMVIAKPLLPVDFVHADHITVGCIDCHHNYNDGTGDAQCYHCHKTDPTVAADIQAHFHEFCRGCHVERQLAGEAGGPVRVCDQCHRENDGFM